MYLVEKGCFSSLNHNPKFMTNLRSIEIDPEYLHRLRRELDRCEINQGSIFPDLAGLCSKIAWKHCYLDGELAYKELPG